MSAPYRDFLAMDLQWFAAEDEGRTEEPSEYKLRKAREEGRVAKSQEFVGALGLLFPALTILFLAPSLLRTSVEMVRFFFLRAGEFGIQDRLAAGVFVRYFARLALPIVLSALASAIFSNMVQVGLLFTTKPLTPDFSKIVPRFGRYFQKTLFSMEGLFNFFKSILKMAIIGIVAFVLIRGRLEVLARLQTADVYLGFTTVAVLAARMLIICALLLLLLSIPDMFFQRWQFRESQKMTREEVKEERKMYEGDPQIRSRIHRRMREFMGRNMAVNVARADVVVTNPTHFAVALEYDEDTMPAPLLTAKGADELAFRIRNIAGDNGVPVMENKPLARALYAEVELGENVPVRYWEAIAQILARVRQLDDERRRADGIGA